MAKVFHIQWKTITYIYKKLNYLKIGKAQRTSHLGLLHSQTAKNKDNEKILIAIGKGDSSIMYKGPSVWLVVGILPETIMARKRRMSYSED